jgi:hypothetical protein
MYLLEFDAKSRLGYGPGIDDALALILALQSPEVRVLGITTVAGNAPARQCPPGAGVFGCRQHSGGDGSSKALMTPKKV